ncbi:MmcQ/YjbR family DNA-binding protein [Acinetobacter baumannii]|uniref:MmcQ/YjbR family DNA-binding protein n=1 Tax=Acinetobacter baumannii TaxID=470 RepID=UPI000DE626D3|nr:MmcQ/YjbR family DNA-binding protein [Acinetobacter baumannii]MBP4543976.1 MmcQ/YjbR family DNA-binding protein [Acinetobacter baumannii]MBP4719498.1 MmcQ/YjbR family DNA-binding protein [Acinetobacter baumannii]MCJ9202478.1 MmcQ/YjbR family DNA-binding protein [Acinetobacter baumannii]MCJ9351217.1 MmcQ/YjbR family DNA-binding protein [Acinetobacter baumannii]MDC4473377.1 MmcQ/YjbR family DNA-binding protein [Acinetobacter baumannii]
MNGEQLHQLAIEAACNLPFSEQTHPFGPEYEVFKILEKMFMLTVEVSGVKMVNVKCDPYKSQEYQELYSFIIPGYHMNKKHWISIKPHKNLTSDFLRDLIGDSYDLVVKKLPLKDQKRLNNQ